jgi:hypothetical protein
LRRYRALAVVLGVVATLVSATPARAEVHDAYYGNRGHAWTNTSEDRVGVEDQRNDGIKIYVEGFLECVDATHLACDSDQFFSRYDEDNSDPEHTVFVVHPWYNLSWFKVCGIWNGAHETRGCGSVVFAD